jgi:hypothetical protein
MCVVAGLMAASAVRVYFCWMALAGLLGAGISGPANDVGSSLSCAAENDKEVSHDGTWRCEAIPGSNSVVVHAIVPGLYRVDVDDDGATTVAFTTEADGRPKVRFLFLPSTGMGDLAVFWRKNLQIRVHQGSAKPGTGLLQSSSVNHRFELMAAKWLVVLEPGYEDPTTNSVCQWDTSNYQAPPRWFSSALEPGDFIPMAQLYNITAPNVNGTRAPLHIHQLGMGSWHLVFPAAALPFDETAFRSRIKSLGIPRRRFKSGNQDLFVVHEADRDNGAFRR